jgi:methyltransferase (TIGR00027 family)
VRAGKPSATAIASAAFRAAHLHLSPGSAIHEDTFALALAGFADRAALFASFERNAPPALPRVAAYFALRHRFSEERLEAALARGVRQVVLLGAGLDSFALRRPDVAQALRYVEIDHPDSQRWKLARLAALGLSTPSVRYVPVDFQTQDLASALVEAGVEPARPTFFAWLGVAQYVAAEAAFDTFALAARHAPGSEIVFDVILPFAGLDGDERTISEFAERSSRGRGEPWLSYFVPEALARKLRSLGFARVDVLGPDAAAPYYAYQPAGVTPLSAWQLLAAVV